MLSKLKRTNDGFRFYEFLDRNDAPCSIQKSSVCNEDLIWLGADSEGPMHLTRDQAAILAKQLEYFAQSGELPATPYK
jgi:hypothetical protein